MSEIETNFYRDPDSVHEETDHAFSIEGYAAMKKQLSADLAALQKLFEHSKLFFAEGPTSIDGRLVLCAFTPLGDERSTSFNSPYTPSTPTAIENLDSALADVLEYAKIDPTWLLAERPTPINDPYRNAAP